MSKEVLAALPGIYDAAASDDKWPEALDRLVSAIGARGAILAATDLVGLPFQVQTACTTYRTEDLEYYFATYGHYEQKGLELMSNNPAGTICRDIDAWPDPTETVDRDDYVFLRTRYGVENRAAVCLSKGKCWSNTLYVQTDKGWSQIPDTFYGGLTAFVPHLAKVVEINRTFTLLRLRYQAVLTALDHIGIGMCIADGRGEIVVANAEAKRIFATGDGLTLGRNGRLVTREDDLANQIRAAIELTARTAGGDALSEEVSILCPRASEGSPLLIEICPLRDSAGELQRRFLGSLVVIIDPDATNDITSAGLAKLFAFSPAETEVCDHLLHGHTARQIAELRDVAHDTVRTQIKALYAKTAVANRVELIRLAISANPPIR